jgi:hypothetical protein
LSIMKRITGVLLVGLLAGCAQPGPGIPGPVAYDAYYDDYYGPFYDGYWGGDGEFYYSDAAGHPFRHAEVGHFRHDGADGFHAVHGLGGGRAGGGMHGGGGAGGGHEGGR